MKKVLISWNELEDALRENGTPEEPIAFIQDWFDAQPDASEMVKCYEESERLMKRLLEDIDNNIVNIKDDNPVYKCEGKK